MGYKLAVTERAEELLEEAIRHLIYKLKNERNPADGTLRY